MQMNRGITTVEHVSQFRAGGKKKGWTLTVERIGMLALPGGQISAGDPSHDLLGPGSPPVLTTVFTPGEYPVDISFASKQGDQRIAAVFISLSRVDAISWGMAQLSEPDRGLILGHEIFIDSARGYVGAFSAAKVLASNGEAVADLATRTHRGSTYEWGEVPVPHAGNLFFFSTGLGDGTYPLSFGLDASGGVVAVFLDFLLLGRP